MSSPNPEESLLARLLELPVAERADYLQRACAEDPALRDRLNEIAEAAGAAGPPAEPAPAKLTDLEKLRAFEVALTAEVAEGPGSRIGHYKLLQKIGEGGFGVVYMAEQEEPVRRRVALKIVKLGMDTREVVARFEAERQALALLDHPNIARVFDAGATETGRPYFVMELVRGVPITKYCDEHNLPTARRLELFSQVCHAMQHAHQKGIIHRDLKPSNILLTLHDSVPVPKVIDFGIAKAVQGRLTDQTLFTAFEQFVGTPAYMSPEQAEMSGLDIDTRSDIYSLGVLLYELLTGRPPFDPRTFLKVGLEEVRRIIREIEPPKPSTRLSTLTDADQSTIAKLRGLAPAQLSTLLRGDLDWIVMRCLEKDRTRRYETASSLAADIQRHLRHEPVTARAPTAAYLLRKLIRRHRFGFAAVTAVAGSLVAGLIVSAVLFLRERAAHSRETDARRRAVMAEATESRLRQQADRAREQETRRASRAALNLAVQLVAHGKITDALAYFVHAARKDPENRTIAPRLASVLTSHNFLLPERAPFACGSPVLAVRYTQDGRSLLVGCADGTLRTFVAATGALEREVRFARPVKRNGWVFARNNDAVAAVRFVDDTVAVIDLASGRMRFAPIQLDPKVRPGEGTDPSVLNAGSLSLSPDGRWLTAEGKYELWLWDATTGELKFQRKFSALEYCDVSPDGARLALVSGDALTLWSLPEGALVHGPTPVARHRAPPEIYLMPRFSNDGKRLVVCDPWEAIHVYDVASGELVRSWPHPDNWILPGAIQFLPDGRLFVGASAGTELWDLDRGHVGEVHTSWGTSLGKWTVEAKRGMILMVSATGIGRLSSTMTGDSVAEDASLAETGDVVAALAPSGVQIAAGTGGGEVRWFRVGRGPARPLEFPAVAAAFTNETPARLRWVTNARSHVIEVVSSHGTDSGFDNPHVPTSVWDRRFSPGARFLVLPVRDEPPEVWDFSAGKKPRVVRGPEKSDYRYQFSPDGNYAACLGRKQREVLVWNLASGALAGPPVAFEGEDINFHAVALSANGRRLATGHAKGAVAIWDTVTGRLVTTLHRTSRAVAGRIVFSPDARRVLVSAEGGEARLWDAQTGAPVSSVIPILAGNDSDIPGAVYSPDGRWLAAVAAHGVELWDAATVTRVGGVIPDTLAYLDSLFFNADGTRLMAGANGEVWDAPSGAQITEATNEGVHSHGVFYQHFSPDGKYVTGIGGDAMVRVRAVPSPLPQGRKTPEWLLQLAAVLAGKSVNDAEAAVVDPGTMAQIDAVRQQLATLTADEPYVEWGRWLLDDSPARSIAPGFALTPAEADQLATAMAGESRLP